MTGDEILRRDNSNIDFSEVSSFGVVLSLHIRI